MKRCVVATVGGGLTGMERWTDEVGKGKEKKVCACARAPVGGWAGLIYSCTARAYMGQTSCSCVSACVRAWLTGWMGLIMGRGWEASGVHELNRKEST